MTGERHEGPFSSVHLRNIFQLDSKHAERLVSRESTALEFKLSFHRGTKWNEYGKTIAAFANTKGGYLVFGVGNNPRTLSGLADSRFSDFDPAEFTQFLNQHFSPEIEWEPYTHRLSGKDFGLIYVSQSREKPVIATAEGGDHIHEGEIYYRYRGRSQRIRYPELRMILNEARDKEHELWMRHFQRIAEIGVHEAAVFDPDQGTVTGRGGVFVIDKTLLPRLKFIREGCFNPSGAPAVRIVGEAQALAAGEILPARTRIQPKSIHFQEIVECFLREDEIESPIEFVRAAAQESSGFVPVYYYLSKAGVSRSQAVTQIKAIRTTAKAKQMLIDRLSGADGGCRHLISAAETHASAAKRALRTRVLEKVPVDGFQGAERRYLLQAIRSLGPTEIDADYIRRLFSHFYSQYETLPGNVRDELRRAICHIDHVLYRPTIKE